MNKDAKIYVAGHQGLVGNAIYEKLSTQGYTNIVTQSFKDLDLRNQKNVEQFFKNTKPEYVFLCAAKVGGILANRDNPAEFIYDNLMIESNVIHYSYIYGVKKLIFLGSSCIYPRDCEQPMQEDYLLTGSLEKTNEPYAIAKIAGIKLCGAYRAQYGCNFISCMPTNLYGPNDNFDLMTSHVIPALISKIYEAYNKKQKKVTIWGTGKPRREFLYIDDLAEAVIFLACNYDDYEPINIGTGTDITISNLAEKIADIIGYRGTFVFDQSRPDGTFRKLLDVSKLNAFGWKAQTTLDHGLKKTIDWFIKTHDLKYCVDKKRGSNYGKEDNY